MSQYNVGFQPGGAATVDTLTGNSGGPVPPTAGNINVIGAGGVTVAGNPGTSTLTITVAGSGMTWSVIAVDQTAVVNNGYFCNKAGTLHLLLPATSAVGDTITVTNENTNLGVQFTQAAGQQILFSTSSSTLGATGTVTSSAIGDTMTLVCKVANTIWRATSMIGNWTPA